MRGSGGGSRRGLRGFMICFDFLDQSYMIDVKLHYKLKKKYRTSVYNQVNRKGHISYLIYFIHL